MDERSTEPISGWRLDNEVRSRPTFPTERRCQEPGCWTILSIYNSGWHCAEHQEEEPHRRRRRAS